MHDYFATLSPEGRRKAMIALLLSPDAARGAEDRLRRKREAIHNKDIAALREILTEEQDEVNSLLAEYAS